MTPAQRLQVTDMQVLDRLQNQEAIQDQRVRNLQQVGIDFQLVRSNTILAMGTCNWQICQVEDDLIVL